MKPNCLSHAFDKWTSEGGFVLVIRKSGHWGFLHVMHIDAGGVLTSYAPNAPLSNPLYALLGFDGSVFGDDMVPTHPVKPWAVVAGCGLLFAHSVRWWVFRTWKRKAK